MKIGMVTYGSNGDVEMFTSLALEMVARKHKVFLFIVTLNDRDYSYLNRYEGLTVYQKPFDADVRNKNELDVESWNQPPESQYDLMRDWYNTSKPEIIEYSNKFCAICDVVIGPQNIRELPCLAEKYKVPYVSIRVYAAFIRSSHEPPFWIEPAEGKTNDELWNYFEGYENKVYKRSTNKFRRQIGLTPVKSVIHEVLDSDFLNLITYSSHLCRRLPDWDDAFQICGYINPPDKFSNWEVPNDLMNFIQGNDKPIFITLGSMLEFENSIDNIHNLLMEVTRKVNRKFIFHSNWGENSGIQDNVYKLSGFISYSKILPYCDLAVHHGGVGTTHIVTEAGCPSVIIEYICEQPYNAHVLLKNGLSSGSVKRADLNVESLTLLIEKVICNPKLKEKAEQIGCLMRKENGVLKAIELIEKRMELVSKSGDVEVVI